MIDSDAEKWAKISAVNAEGDKVLREIPPFPAGKKYLARETQFRDRMLDLPGGDWNVNFETKAIRIVTRDNRVYTLPMSWYPEEGGADGALCSAVVNGTDTTIILTGSSDYIHEETRILFTGNLMKNVIKYRVPGGAFPVAVPAIERLKSQNF